MLQKSGQVVIKKKDTVQSIKKVEIIRPREALKIFDQSQGSGRGRHLGPMGDGSGRPFSGPVHTVLNKVEVYFLCLF